MKKLWKKICVLGICMLLPILNPAMATAGITITPTRVVFEDRDRFKEVTLVNTGDEYHTYEIGWQYTKMIQDKVPPYEFIESSFTDFDLAKHIVYTPRRVTLPPGSKQKVRLALRRPADVAPGEYRAHLYFKMLRDEAPVQEVEQAKAASAAVRINVAYSIPVIFHAGTPDVSATIDSLALDRNPNNGMLQAKIHVTRHGGPYGVLGHLYVYDGKGEVIGEIGNANIFSEIQSRTFTVPIENESNVSGSNLRVVLRHYDKNRQQAYAERSFPVQ